MSELWKLRGREPVLWTIPIYVNQIASDPVVYEFFNAIPLPLAAECAFAHECRKFAWQEEGLWRAKRLDLERHATKENPQDAFNLFSWEKPQLGQAPQFNPELRVERDEFLDALWQSGETGVHSRDELERLWRMFCTHIANWLVNQEKPVDFFLFYLHASPYRANWKELLQAKFPDLGPTMQNAEYQEQQRFLLGGGRMWEDFCSLDLIAVANGLLERGIEVELKQSWVKQVKKVEYERRSALGFKRYAESIVGSLRRRLSVSLRIFLQWYSGSRRPSAASFSGRLHGDIRVLGDFQKSSKVRHPRRVVAALKDRALPAAPTTTPPQPNGAHHPGKDQPVSPVPAAQSPPGDVRDPGQDLHGLNRGAAPAWVLVPPAPEDPDPV